MGPSFGASLLLEISPSLVDIYPSLSFHPFPTGEEAPSKDFKREPCGHEPPERLEFGGQCCISLSLI